MSGGLKGKLALITGATHGIGAAVAKRFAAEGAHVILVGRTQGALEELDDEIGEAGGQATLVPLDLRDFDAIDRMGFGLHERFAKLDILIGNAGVLPLLSPAGHLDPKVWQEIIDVNLTANWRLIRSLDPLLRRADAGRAMFTTCAAGREASPYWNAYAAAKAGLEALVRSYAAEIAGTPIRVNLVDPGPVHTKLRNNAFPAEDKSRLRRPQDVTDLFVAAASMECATNAQIIA